MNNNFDSCNIKGLREINTIFCNGKNYKMEVSETQIGIWEKYQDNKNVWHTSITPKYFLTGEEVQYLFMDIGSDYAYNILQYLQGVKAI